MLVNLSARLRACNPRCAPERAPRPLTLRRKDARASLATARVRASFSHVHSATHTIAVFTRGARALGALDAVRGLRRASLDNPPALRAWTRGARRNLHGAPFALPGGFARQPRGAGAWRATKRVRAAEHRRAATHTASIRRLAFRAGEHGARAAPTQARARPTVPRTLRPRLSRGGGGGLARALSRPHGEIWPTPRAHAHVCRRRACRIARVCVRARVCGRGAPRITRRIGADGSPHGRAPRPSDFLAEHIGAKPRSPVSAKARVDGKSDSGILPEARKPRYSTRLRRYPTFPSITETSPHRTVHRPSRRALQRASKSALSSQTRKPPPTPRSASQARDV